MSDEIEIAQATQADLDVLAPLFDAYRQFYQQPGDLAGAREFLDARLAKAESVIFIVRRSGQAVGFTQLYPTFSSVSMKRQWILNDLFVAPGGRHLGVGKALLERARQHGIETGAKGLVLQTAWDNISAQTLYESLGWTRDEAFHTYVLLV